MGSEHRAGGKEELAPRWDHGVVDKVPSVKEREKMLSPSSFLLGSLLRSSGSKRDFSYTKILLRKASAYKLDVGGKKYLFLDFNMYLKLLRISSV